MEGYTSSYDFTEDVFMNEISPATKRLELFSYSPSRVIYHENNSEEGVSYWLRTPNCYQPNANW
jgi:hypothetical protein